MADASRPPPSPPADWGAAFAGLPQDAPPASRWPMIAAQLDARDRRDSRKRLRIRWAIAAGLCALAASPLLWRMRETTSTPAIPHTTAVAPTVTHPRTPSPVVAMPAPRTADTAATVASTAPRVAAVHTRSARATRAPTASRAVVGNATAARAGAASSTDRLASLHAASAQLEDLLALARDPRVESGPAAALAGAYDTELAAIDAQLAMPGLPEADQLSLWQARVDTLRQSAGLESQLRLLAADGARLDGALVSID